MYTVKPVTLFLVFLLTLIARADPCHEARLRSGIVFGNAIYGSVLTRTTKVQRLMPMKLVRVNLYSDDRLVRSVTTERTGKFIINQVSPGKYRLAAGTSDTVDIEVRPQPRENRFSDLITLEVNGSEVCVVTTSVSN